MGCLTSAIALSLWVGVVVKFLSPAAPRIELHDPLIVAAFFATVLAYVIKIADDISELKNQLPHSFSAGKSGQED